MKSIHRLALCGLVCGIACSAIFGATLYHEARAQPSPMWGDLRPGPYEVGYRVEFMRDRSRGYGPRVDWRGRGDSTAARRPMQISLWYPADPSTDGDPGRSDDPGRRNGRMTYGAYVRTSAGALGPAFDTPARREAVEQELARGPMSPFFEDGISDRELDAVLATPMAAVRGARPADGRFPVVIHGGAGLTGQTVLLEYLASHGYVVLSVPLLGTAPAWFGRGQGTPEYYQVGADDVGFLHGYAAGLPFADASRTAMIGMLSAFGLLYQMQHQQLAAIAALDGSYAPALRSVPGYDSVAVRIPILDMPRTNPTSDRSVLDGLRFADRHLVQLEDVDHIDFYQFRRAARPERAAEHDAYRMIAQATLAFLDGVLQPDPVGGDALTSLERAAAAFPEMDVGFTAGDAPIPTSEEFLLLLREGRFDEARTAWQNADCGPAPCTLARESDATVTLLFYRRDELAQEALDGFRLLAEMFPESETAREHLRTTAEAAADN